VAAVGIDGLHRQVQALRDLARADAFTDQPEHFQLAVRERRDGIFVDAGSTGNLLTENKLSGNVFDAWDESSGTGTAGTANRWKHNKGQTSFPAGLFG